MRALLRTRRYTTASQSVAMESLRRRKRALRESTRDKLKQVSARDVAEQSLRITNRVLQLPIYKNATRISIFLSMPEGEVSTGKLVEQALAAGKKVFVPYIHRIGQSRAQEMDMLELRSREELELLEADIWGIPSLDKKSVVGRENALGGLGVGATKTEEAKAQASFLDLIFMPAIAFDRHNGRLGHGKGFYDRYLEKYKELALSRMSGQEMPLLIGLALKQQILSEGELVPTGTDDWKVDQVVTATEKVLDLEE